MNIYYNMEPDYWGGQAPPVELLGGQWPPRPPGSYSTELQQLFVQLISEISLFSTYIEAQVSCKSVTKRKRQSIEH